jgi:transposase
MSIDQDTCGYIRYLRLKEGYSIRAIARKTGAARQTIRQILSVKPPKTTRTKASKLDPFKASIESILKEKPGFSSVLILEKLRQQGYGGGKSSVYDFIHHFRQRPGPAFIPLTSLPGEQAQVDWAECGYINCGQHQRKLYVFVMTLCYSRYLFLEFTVSMEMDAFLACHVQAFDFFGGIPRELIYDNLKCVVLDRIKNEIHFNARYLDFATHFGIAPKVCNVRSPHEKGKVERVIEYIKGNFLARGPFENFEQIKLAGKNWLNQIANQRLHSVTRKIPCQAFVNEEKALLKPLPPQAFDYSVPHLLPVSKLCLVNFQTNKYSVPSKYAHTIVTLKATTTAIKISVKEQLIAVHRRSYDKHQWLKNPDHYQELLAQKQRAQTTATLEKFEKFSVESKAYLAGLLQQQLNVHYQVKKILELVATFGSTAVAAALVKALAHQAFHWEYIKNIILETNWVDYQTLPVVAKVSKEILDIDVAQSDLSQYDKF